MIFVLDTKALCWHLHACSSASARAFSSRDRNGDSLRSHQNPALGRNGCCSSILCHS